MTLLARRRVACCPVVSYVAYARVTDDESTTDASDRYWSAPTLCVGGPVTKVVA